LPGVTRESILQLGPDLGLEVSEDRIDVREMFADIESGRITEAFAMGTGAVIAPVGRFGYKEKNYVINDNETGPVAQRLFEALTDIQYGRVADPYGWTRNFAVGDNNAGAQKVARA
jgi:branched-chain amino acid aminotransferase